MILAGKYKSENVENSWNFTSLVEVGTKIYDLPSDFHWLKTAKFPFYRQHKANMSVKKFYSSNFILPFNEKKSIFLRLPTSSSPFTHIHTPEKKTLCNAVTEKEYVCVWRPGTCDFTTVIVNDSIHSELSIPFWIMRIFFFLHFWGGIFFILRFAVNKFPSCVVFFRTMN